MYFSFYMIFTFLAIFQFLQCGFLIFHVLQWFHHFSSRHVDVSHFPWYSFLAIFHVPQWIFLNYPTFSVFLAIFQVLKCVFLIFCDFQFSRHIPHPTVCIYHFSRFSVISSFFKSSSGCFSFSVIFSFLIIFHVLLCAFLIFHVIPWFPHFSSRQVDVSHFP